MGAGKRGLLCMTDHCPSEAVEPEKMLVIVYDLYIEAGYWFQLRRPMKALCFVLLGVTEVILPVAEMQTEQDTFGHFGLYSHCF